ncbi:hypothetical protein [Planctellipticum variicoloris]|uniref:hypothetical protein n=1 Tax=Planctellipticum variicoloris TaxID=3064265 RepID=UPI002CF8515E|nr:hypothetical protein SH412_005538 [Planctomycetaceae bacterium SH412]HTN00230.1 hypothetical protein [Planctomycetaceae bacterium]
MFRHTQRFPKHLQQSYTLKLELLAFDFQEASFIANTVRGATSQFFPNVLLDPVDHFVKEDLRIPAYVRK